MFCLFMMSMYECYKGYNVIDFDFFGGLLFLFWFLQQLNNLFKI